MAAHHISLPSVKGKDIWCFFTLHNQDVVGGISYEKSNYTYIKETGHPT